MRDMDGAIPPEFDGGHVGIEELENKYAALSEAIDSAMAYHRMIFDADGTPCDYVFLEVNEAFEEFTGLKGADIIGRQVTEVIPGIRDADPDLISFYGEVTLSGVPKSMEFYFSPLERWYEARAFRPRKDHFTVLFTNVTERYEARRKIEVYARELERSNRDLEQFAYSASHDLQEPLRMITSFLNLLQQHLGGSLDDKGTEYLAYAADGARRLKAMINDLLLFSRVGIEGRPLEPLALDAAVTQAMGVLSERIAEYGASVVVAPDLPKVLGDEGQLVQLLQNLLGNALKFQRPGVAPEIHVSASREGEEWVITVADNGIGIDPRYFGRIFEVFQRLHGRRVYDGSGIGLAICRRIVERHAGRIWVESEEGQGAMFRFTLLPLDSRRGE
ncbi:MAG: ATP-binding protein [Pseudomonadota bacterium]